MNITYKIENYYADEQRAFVVYFSGDLPPMGAWVCVTPEMSETEVKNAVVAAAPVHKWTTPATNTIVENLIGIEKSATYVAPQVPEPQPADIAQQVRQQRNNLLRLSDWTQTLDAPIAAEQQAQWQTYRQALRDITGQAGFPDEVVWPTKPQ